MPRLFAALVMLVAIVALVGFGLRLPALASFNPRWMSTAPLSATALLLAGISLWLSAGGAGKRSTARGAAILAVSVIAAGVGGLVATFVSWYGGASLGGLGSWPWIMAPNTAIGLILSGAALFALVRDGERARRVSQACALLAGVTALATLIAYTYGSQHIYGMMRIPSTSVPASVAFLALSTGIVFAGGSGGLLAVFRSPGMGGRVARRILPAAVLVPALLGLVEVLLISAGVDHPFAAALHVGAVIAVFGAVVWWSAFALERLETQRTAAVEALGAESERLRQSRSFLEEAQSVAHVGSWVSGIGAADLLEWSPEVYRVFGVGPGEPLTVDRFFSLVHPADLDAVRAASAEAIAGGRSYDVTHRGCALSPGLLMSA